MILSTAVLCLALNVYYEARGESLIGQYGVALVTLNRAEKDEDKVCEVVLERGQFSWTADLVRHKKLTAKIKDDKAWIMAQYIAETTLDGKISDVTYGATSFHVKWIRPGWDRKMKRTVTLGHHVFYREV